MASLLSGFEYDIFVSYRQNDNKYDKWVTEFVSNLRRELDSTIKEKISIYLDENPYDGLLENYNIDKSLSNKLKALIFIPVLSQTYCDPKSYAWQNEFLAFNTMANEDQNSRDVVLRNGNIASRILPIKIHDLDPEDLKLLTSVLGSQVRSIDFIYKETGVNRPLRPEDNEEKNLSRTKYRNQVNKVANSIKEILTSLRNPVLTGQTNSASLPSVGLSSLKSIAVLPFVNMSNDQEQEYFSDGISEEIINTLVQIPSLKVSGRTSSFSFKNKSEDLRTIGEKLNVNTILEGSVRKAGNRIRISAQLVEASSGFPWWSQKFDRELNDVFTIQDEIAKAIVDKLQEGKTTKPRERIQTQNVDAYQLYLKGMAFFYKRGLHMFEGLKCFEDALKIDPDYALALTGLADTNTMLCLHSYMPPEEAWPKAVKAASRALEIGKDLAEVHCALATIALLFERNWKKAENEYLKAIELNPYYIQNLCWYSIFYFSTIKLNADKSIEYARKAIEYDPLSSYPQSILSNVAANAGVHDVAIDAGIKAVEYDPESFSAWYFKGYSNYCAGNFSNAINDYEQAINISGRHCWALSSLLALLTDPSEYQDFKKANFIYQEFLTKERTGYMSPFLLSSASAAVGKKEEAVRYAKLGIERRDPLFVNIGPSRPDSKAVTGIPEVREMMMNIGFKITH